LLLISGFKCKKGKDPGP